MKTIKNYFSILVVVLLSTLAFTACSSSDDDSPAGDDKHDSALIGAWVGTQVVDVEDFGKVSANITLVFKSNGTGELIAEAMGVTAPAQSFKWNTQGNKLYMTAKDSETGKEETAENTYAISGKSLTIKADTGDVMSLTRK